MQKSAGIRALVYRAFHLPLTENNRTTELNNIFYICKVNGYPNFILNNIINKVKRNKENIHNRKQKVENKFIPLEYHNKTSEIINKIFNRKGYTAGFRTKNNVEQFIGKPFNVNNSTNKYDKPGVYKIISDDYVLLHILVKPSAQ